MDVVPGKQRIVENQDDVALELQIETRAKVVHHRLQTLEMFRNDLSQPWAKRDVVGEYRRRHEILALDVLDQFVVGRIAARQRLPRPWWLW